jgi:acyl-CoA thioesterase-2
MRPVGLFDVAGVHDAGFSAWVRTKADLGDDITFNQAVMAHVSDAGILEASMRPHDVRFWTPGMQCASLDHAMWFHRPAHMRDWHLYVQDSPSASGARGFTRGSFYSQDGVLVASVAQEGLIRKREV